MDPIAALTLATTVIETLIKVAPVVIQTGIDLKIFAVTLFERFTGQTISAEDRTALEASIDALHAEFQLPIPPDDQQ